MTDREFEQAWDGVAVSAAALMVVVLVGLLLFALYTWAETPVVYTSAATNECVRVVDPAGRFSCDSLPIKYDHVWVE